MKITIAKNSGGQFILEGIPGTFWRKMKKAGWIWARGLNGFPGCYYTENPETANTSAQRLKMQIERIGGRTAGGPILK